MNGATHTPPAELAHRIGRFQEALERNAIGGALILQVTDRFYFSGTIQQGGLYIPASGPPLLMVRKDLQRAVQESGIEDIVDLQRARDYPARIADFYGGAPKALGLELDVLPASQYLSLHKAFPDSKLTDVSTIIRAVRAVKSPFEIAQHRQAAIYSDHIARDAAEMIREGISEIALAGEIEARARKLGHQGIVRMRMWGGEMFYGHLMAGASAAEPSFLASPTGGSGVSPAVAQGPGLRPIRRGEPILLDYVFVHNGYISDHTRVFALGGVDAELARAHDAMLAVHEAIQTAAVPPIPAGELYAMAVEQAKALGYGAHFMGTGPRRIRFIGHGVGLELDEFPFLAAKQTMPLEEGMVIALEPKCIFPGKGVVGIENTHVVTASGLEQLGRYPSEICVR
jgi:Xaa-Pro dipeptidase